LFELFDLGAQFGTWMPRISPLSIPPLFAEVGLAGRRRFLASPLISANSKNK